MRQARLKSSGHMCLASLILILFLLTLSPCSMSAQEEAKFELEERVSHLEVPEIAKDSLCLLIPSTTRIRWYKDISHIGQTYEAKFKHEGSRYSVEFDSLGHLADIEVELSWKHMQASEKTALNRSFSSIQGFKLQRIQAQWTGRVIDLTRRDGSNGLIPKAMAYEVEFKGEMNERFAYWEGLFTPEGELLDLKEVLLKDVENLNLN